MNTALLRLEMRRTLRNRRVLLITTVFPVVFFLGFSGGDQAQHLGGLTIAPYVMASMATYAAMNALFAGGGLIATERAVGWSRQLRVAGLRGRDYVLTKLATAYLTAVPGLVLVFVVAAVDKHVRLSAVTWVATAVAILAALLPVAALGVAVGYLVRVQNLQPLLGIGSALLALLGGIWVPTELFPRALRDIVQALPTYWSADAGRAALRGTWIGWEGVAVLLAWTVALGALAAHAYQRDSMRPAVAGAA